MGFFDRLKSGWALGIQSLRIILQDKSLLFFPILSGISALLAIGAIWLGVGPETLSKWLDLMEKDSSQVPPIAYILAFGLYFLLYFITIFFNVALMACARRSLQGADTTVSEGLQAAVKHLGSIIAWSAVAGTVGLLLSMLENEERAGRWVRSILGGVWSAITFFVIPVMIFEEVSVFGAIGRSTKIMCKTWGENLAAQFSIGLLGFVLALPAVALIALCMMANSATLMVLGIISAVIYMAIVNAVCATAKTVLTVALYEYAANGTTPKGYSQNDINHAFASR